MGLADDLLAPVRTSNRGATCGVTLVLEQMDKDDPDAAAALRAVMADVRFPATVIARRLDAAGWDLPPGVIQRHRRRECKCPT